MEIIWWDKPNGNPKYLKSYNQQNDTLTGTDDAQLAVEISSTQIQTVKDWLVNNMGISQSILHSGTKPPK